MKNFLKRIELQGFKSFAGKTVLEFPERVTAIVGHNGSGKSNVIDALRWVLGEREAKQLRGDTLNTLIFAGTPKKPAVSLAKVALYFDNESRVFPIDTEEVMLVRKIDRSGLSQSFKLGSWPIQDLASFGGSFQRPLQVRNHHGSRCQPCGICSFGSVTPFRQPLSGPIIFHLSSADPSSQFAVRFIQYQVQRLTPRSSRTQPARSGFLSFHSSFITSFSSRSQVGPLSFFR